MGYDLTWANDPHEAERLAVFEAVMARLSTIEEPFTPERFSTWSSAGYRAMEALGGYVRFNQALMGSLIVEMEAQGMFQGNESMREKLERQSGTITPEEIGAALEHADAMPTTSVPQVEVGALEQEMAATALELEGEVATLSSVENLLTLHPIAWLGAWVRWMTFLMEAHKNGGIRVG